MIFKPKYLLLTLWLLTFTACIPSNTVDSNPDRLYWAEVDVPLSPEFDDSHLAKGKTLFSSYCATCHGEQGHGNGRVLDSIATPPGDFSFALFKLRSTDGFPSDEDFFRTITAGMPPYDMPSTRQLSAEDRWLIVHYMKTLIKNAAPEQSQTPGKAIILPNAKPNTKSSIDMGKVYYNKMGCAYCHGSNGIANTAIALKDAQGNPITPRNFQDGPDYFKGGGRPEDIVRILMTGMAGTPMQPYGRIGADNQELWDVAHYVHSLATASKKETK